MSDLVDLLKSSGPVSLDELNLRSSESPGELTSKLDSLRRRGLVSISGPNADTLPSMEADEIESASDTFVSLTRSAFRSSNL